MSEEAIETNNKLTPDNLGSADQWKRVGVFAAGFESPYYGQIIQSIFNYLTTRKYQTVHYSSMHKHLSEQLNYATLDDLNCEGVIINSQSLGDEELEVLMVRFDKAILLNHHLESFAGQCVYPDDVTGGKLAARHLLDHGHERIGVITGPLESFETRNRTKGFESELASARINVEVLATGNFLEQGGVDAMNQILSQSQDITAVFVQNDEMAFGALTACRQRGVRVPEDISVIGYDGLAMGNSLTPKLTTIQQPLRVLGEQAASLLCNMLEKPSSIPTTATVLQPVLLERESVAAPLNYRPERIILSNRENECLTWTARGKTSWEISVILGISESTASFHLRNTVTKLKASNRAHAVAKALQTNLISL